MKKVFRFLIWLGAFLVVLIGGAAVGGFLVAWIRTLSTGTTLFFKGKRFLEVLLSLVPCGGTVSTFWETNDFFHNLTAFVPGFVLGGIGALLLWGTLSLVAAWQNCLLFPKATLRMGFLMTPLLGYIPLFTIERNPEKDVPHLIALFPFALTVLLVGAAVRTTRQACLPDPDRPPPPDRSWDFLAVWVVSLAAVNQGWQWLEVALTRHNHFFSQAYDTGLMSHVMNNFITGRGLTSTLLVSGGSFLGHHFSPILYLLAPFYFFCPHPELLITIQTLVVASAALPLFYFARRFLASTWAAVAVALTYLYVPGLSEGIYGDYHTISFVPFLLFWLAYETTRLDRQRFWVPLILCFLVQENVVFYVTALAAFFLFEKKYRSRALILAGVSVVAGLVIFLVFQPLLKPQGELGYGFVHRYRDFLRANQTDNAGMKDLVEAIPEHPETFASLVFEKGSRSVYQKFWGGTFLLPLWNPRGWVLLLPCLENTLSSEPHLHFWKGHYGLGPAALSTLAVVAGFHLLLRWSFLASRIIQISWIFFFSQVLWALKHTLLPYSIFMMSVYFNNAIDSPATLDILYSRIPPGCSVAAPSYLIPHLTYQRQLYLLPPGSPRLIDGTPLIPNEIVRYENLVPDVGWPEYLVYNPAAPDGLPWYNAWFFSKEKTLAWLEWLRSSGKYRVIYPAKGAASVPDTSVIILERSRDNP